MNALAITVLALALRFAPPGTSPYSLLPMPECGQDPASSSCAGVALCDDPRLWCRAPKWSRYHHAWVRYEPVEVAVKRYRRIADQLVRTAQRLEHCRGQHCAPLEWEGSERDLVLSTLTVALHESGLRRDVQYGEKPLGRGPNGEACLLQIDLEQAPRFAGWLSPEERASISKSKEGRERFAQTLLGESTESMGRCFEIGMRMLARARRSCSKSASRDHGMFSMFGSGTTCNAPILANRTKTLTRLRATRPKLRPEHAAVLNLRLEPAEE